MLTHLYVLKLKRNKDYEEQSLYVNFPYLTKFICNVLYVTMFIHNQVYTY